MTDSFLKQSRIAFILAGGNATRLKLPYSKVFVDLGGQRMIDYVIQAVHPLVKTVYVVISPAMVNHMKPLSGVVYVVQDKPLGTGDAFRVAFQAACSKEHDIWSMNIMVLCGDTPLLTPDHIQPLLSFPLNQNNGDILVMGMIGPLPADTIPYGRVIIRTPSSWDEQTNIPIKGWHPIDRIVEAKDATAQERAVTLCNTGIMLLSSQYASECLSSMEPSPITGEFYLTDFIKKESSCWVFHSDDNGYDRDFWGVNTPEELLFAQTRLQERFYRHAQEKGVLFHGGKQGAPMLSHDTRYAPGIIIHPHVVIGPNVILEENVTLFSFSVLSHCCIRKGAQIGPFAHIRGESSIGPESIIGNFVEVKNLTMGMKSKAKHLSYLGDTHVGHGVNIGAGVITCNYDGHEKHMTYIEDNAFIGSHASLVAPLRIGESATVGAGSVITASVDHHTLSLSRTPQRSIALPETSKHLNRKKKISP